MASHLILFGHFAKTSLSSHLPHNHRAEAAATGLLLATDVADYLVNRGIPFRTAHEVVGGIVRDLVERGQDFSSLSSADWQRYHKSFGADIVGQITARGSVEARQTPQSTNPAAVGAALANVLAWIQARRG